jgi:hypothetical protein
MRPHCLGSAGIAVHLAPLAGRGRIASAIRVRGSFRKGAGDRFQDARRVSEDVVVPKSQDAIVMIDKPFVANRIVRAVCVLSSIHFDYETTFTADKVDCVWTNRFLPDKLVSIEPTRSKPVPQSRFGFSARSSQASGALRFDLVGTSQPAAPPHPDCFAIRPFPASGERLAPHAM